MTAEVIPGPTRTDAAGPDEWLIDDDIVRLRRWALETVHPLPSPSTAEVVVGAGAVCDLVLDDPAGRISRQHARLTHDGRWTISDLGSKNGLRMDGSRRQTFPLAAGVEVGIGGLTLIAESPRWLALRGFVQRLIGWSPERAEEVDLAMRALRIAATRRDSLLLHGDGDLMAIAQSLHRRTLGTGRPCIVCDPRRRSTEATVRSAENHDTGLEALRAAAGGTLCVWSARLPADFPAVLDALRDPAARVQLVVCSHAADTTKKPTIAAPITLPPLADRASELDRVIDEYGRDAVTSLAVDVNRFTPADRAWVRAHTADSLPEIEKATRRLVALRDGGNVARAAVKLGMSHVALSQWIDRRRLPD